MWAVEHGFFIMFYLLISWTSLGLLKILCKDSMPHKRRAKWCPLGLPLALNAKHGHVRVLNRCCFCAISVVGFKIILKSIALGIPLLLFLILHKLQLFFNQVFIGVFCQIIAQNSSIFEEWTRKSSVNVDRCQTLWVILHFYVRLMQP